MLHDFYPPLPLPQVKYLYGQHRLIQALLISNPLNLTTSSGHTPLSLYVKRNPKFDTPLNPSEHRLELFTVSETPGPQG